MVAFMVRNVATHHLAILNRVAQINIALVVGTALLAVVVRVVRSLLFPLAIFDPGAFCPAGLSPCCNWHGQVSDPH
jgi:hypothetical protein